MKLLLPANHKYLKKVERGYIYADADGVWYDAVTLPKEKIDYSEVMELMPPSAAPASQMRCATTCATSRTGC